MSESVKQVLTINLEDYFQVTPVSGVVQTRYWNRFERRVERNTAATLDLLDRHNATATFFVSGWIADVAPDLVAEIVRRGHRIAAKGYRHEFAKNLTPAEFEADARRAKDALERASGDVVFGYRAARGGLRSEDHARFAALARAGYAFDSSVRPFGFGVTPINDAYPSWQSDPDFIELPITAGTWFGLTIPVGGGNYLRQLPERLTLPALHRVAEDPNTTAVFYFHVWELDPEMPRLNGVSRLNRIRQYRNLEAMRRRIETVLSAYAFTSAEAVLGLERRAAELVPASQVPIAAPVRGGQPLTLVIPCFNEADALPFLDKTLALLSDRLSGRYDLRYVFVDDASTDTTAAVLERTFGHRADATIITHSANKGVSAAIMSGIAASRTELVASLDCDCSYDPFQIEALLDRMAPGVAMVTASPYHREGHVLNVPGWRLMLSRGLSLLYRTLLTHKFATYTACFRVYRRSAIAGIAPVHGDYLGIAELLIRLDRSGRTLTEVPATLEARLFGRSKMKTLRTIAGHLRLLFDLVTGRLAPPPTNPPAPISNMEKNRG